MGMCMVGQRTTICTNIQQVEHINTQVAILICPCITHLKVQTLPERESESERESPGWWWGKHVGRHGHVYGRPDNNHMQ